MRPVVRDERKGTPRLRWPTVEQVMLSDRDILDEFKQRIAGHFSDSSSQLGDMQPQVARRGCDPLRRSLRPRLQRSRIGGWLRFSCMARFGAH